MFRNSIHNSLQKYKKEVPCCKIKLGIEKVEQNADKILQLRLFRKSERRIIKICI
jgi:hypothetical protein